MELILLLGTDKSVELRFQILDNPIADLWQQRMNLRHAWPLDDHNRFYGFRSKQDELNLAITGLKQCIETINAYQNIIALQITDVVDQNELNYLHSIFERYHGQLNCQTTDWWRRAPIQVQQALAQLNVLIHRHESLNSNRPRLVCTWWGMPKNVTLDPGLCQTYGQVGRTFGSVYLNYCEIGKTLLELARDRDEHAGDSMFLPFAHYSADFVVSFYDDTEQNIKRQQQLIDQYWHQRQDFFRDQGVDSPMHWRAQQMQYKVAQLTYSGDRSNLLKKIAQNQYIAHVSME